MPDRPLAWWLARLLPERAGRDVFEPAWCDLRIEHLTRRDGVRPGPARATLDAWHAVRVLALFLDCWRLELAGAPARLRHPPPTIGSRPPQERSAVFLYQLRHALRRLVREPAFTLAAVLTLALGVGANVAVFAVVESVLLRPLPYPEAERLVILNHRDQRTGITKEFIAIGDFVDLKTRQTSFEALGAYDNGQMTVYGAAEPYQVSVLNASADALAALRFRPAFGRGIEPEDSRPGAGGVVVLGHELWRTRFGADSAVVGRNVRIGQRDRLVVGVAPPGFHFPPNAKTDVVLGMQLPVQAPAQRKSGWTFAVGRLGADRTAQDAAADLAAVARQLETEYPEDNQASTYFPLPLRDAMVGSTRSALVLLLAAVGVVLLIACANVANLLLARSLARRREMALRMALGAGRARLASQLLVESLVLAVAAGACGIAIAHWGARALVALVPPSMNVPGLADVRINGLVLTFALVLTGATTLAFGVVAALSVRFESASGALVVGARSTMGAMAQRATSALVVAESAFAIVLLIGAGLILRSFASLLSVDPGFRVDGVLTMQITLPADRYGKVEALEGFYRRAFASLAAIPQVQDAGAGVVVPLTGNNWTVPFERPERPVPPGERPPEVGWQVASGGFFRALEIPLRAGRLFDERDRPSGKTVVIVSESIQRLYFPNESAVGRQVRTGDGAAEIVGVVGDIRRAGLRDDPRADMYFPFEMGPGTQITLFVRTASDPTRLLAPMKGVLREIEPNVVFSEARTLADIASDSVRVTQLVLWLLGIFAATALALAAVGIYGVMSYVVRQRTREIGTRIALGAPRSGIVWLVMRQGATIAALGTGVGLLLGLAATRLLRSILFGISATDPVVLVVAPLVLAAVTMFACYVPARRAASVDPARTLTDQ